MKTSLICLIGCWLFRYTFDFATAQTVEVPTAKDTAAILYISGGTSGNWLTIKRANLNDYEQRGFDPSYVAMFSDFKPIVKKLTDGRWQIQFESEIAQSLP